MSDRPVVLVVRDPDSSNEITTWGIDNPCVIDVDLGYMDVASPDEFPDWAASLVDTIDQLGDHPAATSIRNVLAFVVERYHEELCTDGSADMDKVRDAVANGYPVS